MKYKRGLLYGRFQPFHKGHLYLLKNVLDQVDELVIGIGSANVHDSANIFDVAFRKKMVEIILEQENLDNKISAIVPLDDFPDDDIWFQETVKKIGQIEVVIGNNEWTNRIFEKNGYEILRVPYFKRYLYEGIKIRKLLQTDGDWQSRVPMEIVPLIKQKLRIM